MSFYDNPFYLLGASLSDHRKRIALLAEEKSLFLDPDKCLEMLNILINPQRRISAEISWFPGCPDEMISKIIDYIITFRAGKVKKLVKIFNSSMEPIVQLNLRLACLESEEINNAFQAKDAVLEVSRLFAVIDAEHVRQLLNERRKVAGFPSIENVAEIENAVSERREYIRQIIAQKLGQLPRDSYVEVITLLSSKYKDDQHYTGSTILDDVLNTYAIDSSGEIQQKKQQIVQTIEFIMESIEKIRVEDAITDLINMVIKWNKLVRPLRLSALARGTEDRKSKELAYEIRGFAVSLHKQFDMTDQSLRLTKMLKSSFSELPDLSSVIKRDLEELNFIQNKKIKTQKNEKGSVLHSYEDKKYSVTLNAARIVIPSFCTCCLLPTRLTEKVRASATQRNGGIDTTRTVSLDFPICEECLAHRKAAKSRKMVMTLLSLMIGIISAFFLRDVAIDRSLPLAIPLLVSVVVFVLLGLLIKIPTLEEEHSTTESSIWLGGIQMHGNQVTYTFTNGVYARRFAEANNATIAESRRRNRTKSRSIIKAVDHPVIRFFATVATLFLVIVVWNNMMSPDTSKSSSKPPMNNSHFSSTEQSKLDALKEDLDGRRMQIEAMEDELRSLLNDMDYYKSMCDSTHDNIYVDQYNGTLDQYNALGEDYEKAISDYNQRVAEYNRLIKE